MGAAALFGVVAALAPFAAQADPGPRAITVSGEGTAAGAPDRAILSAGVTTLAPTAAQALAANARKMTGVFNALKKLGVPDRLIQTSNFSVQPQYANTSGNEQARITGYLVSNQVDVTLDDVKKLGPALDALVAAGSNQINSVGFEIKDTDTLEAKAREAAIADARNRAETYVRAAGASLGAVQSIAETGSGAPMPVFRAKAMFANDAATPTAAGELTVTANVSVTFELK
ncbi:MAG: SIMPL domain-containing protein [Proteobacteria bacterium]|nr:SIMPL domain-containing protein [Pseudomonadota bacterium]